MRFRIHSGVRLAGVLGSLNILHQKFIFPLQILSCVSGSDISLFCRNRNITNRYVDDGARKKEPPDDGLCQAKIFTENE